MEARSVESWESCFTMWMVSALMATAITSPMAKSIHCVLYLYQPETRSIPLSYQSSTLFCSFTASLPAIVIIETSGLPTFLGVFVVCHFLCGILERLRENDRFPRDACRGSPLWGWPGLCRFSRLCDGDLRKGVGDGVEQSEGEISGRDVGGQVARLLWIELAFKEAEDLTVVVDIGHKACLVGVADQHCNASQQLPTSHVEEGEDDFVDGGGEDTE